MKTEFTVRISLSARHIQLMRETAHYTLACFPSKDTDYLESKGLALVSKFDEEEDIICMNLTELGKNILAEVESSEWQMQPGFVVTQLHIEVLKHLLEREYMSVTTARVRGFTEVTEDMTGVGAPFPFLCHAGVNGGWVVMRYEGDGYPDYVAEAKNQIRKWNNRHTAAYIARSTVEEYENHE